MKLNITWLVLIGILVVMDIDDSSAWWSRRKPKPPSSQDGNPYYFGTTNLWCLVSNKKRAPSRSTIALNHRFIYYEGYYFERLRDGDVFDTEPALSDECSWKKEESPAGYSKLSVDCIKRCTKGYSEEFGEYSLLTNNCHYFANKISEVLYDYATCPDWCN